MLRKDFYTHCRHYSFRPVQVAVKRDPAESGLDPWDAQDAMFRSSEKTAELPLPKRRGNAAELAASKTGQ